MNHPTDTNDPIDLLAETDATPNLNQLAPLRPRTLLGVGKSNRHWARWVLAGGTILLGLGVASIIVERAQATAARNETVRELPRRLVSRVDFESKMTAAGRVESHSNTVINCEIERLSVSNEGRVLTSNGMSQILELIPEGTVVKKGDLLCRLNSTDYEEIVRTQLMKTEQARAALEQAQLNFDVAELAVREYSEGLKQQSTQELEGQIALIESDLERANDRLRWTRQMLEKGYVPVSQRATAERTVAELQHKLMTSRWDLVNFNKYGDARTLKELESEVEKRRYEVVANTQRVARLDERLTHYRKMVDFCTIRSPRDGLLIYAVDPRRRNAPPLEPGVDVHQQQPLFYLPDLKQMEVVTYLHESVASKVVVGNQALIRIEGMGNRVLAGRVVARGPLPVSSPVWTTSDEVKYFVATIKLDENPSGLLPGMSAEVEIDLDRSRDVLAVPTEAIASEDGRDICYVAGAEGLERRRITVGRSNNNLLEVTQGLVEGEEVVINPDKIDALNSLLTHTQTDSGSSREVAPESSVGAGAGSGSVE